MRPRALPWQLACPSTRQTTLTTSIGPSEEEIAALLRQLETGVPAAALELLELPVVLARGEYLALHEAGINSPLHLWRFGNSQLAELLGARRVAELEHHRPKDKLAA